LNTYSFSHSASLYFSGQIARLQEIVRALVIVSTALLTPCVLLIYVFGAEILTLFGERYATVYPTLIVLSTACFLMSLTGSASVILLTTGNELIYSRIITLATVARVAFTAVLAWRFGAFGAACGWALVNAPLFMILSVVCRRLCGVDTSILSVLRDPRGPSAVTA
jgi:O-antigen/teichoic acid export membrane protein